MIRALPSHRTFVRLAVALAIAALAVADAAPVLAGEAPETPLSLGSLLTSWSTDPITWLAIAFGVAIYLVGVGLVNRRHPHSRVPRWRVIAWLAGMASLALALVSVVDVYATSLLTVHMVQHLLLAMVVPPLLAFGAPVTLALRVAIPSVRRSLLLPLLHSRIARLLAAPMIGWVVYLVVLSGSHFSPLFSAALDDPLVHIGEHLLYLGAGLLFWWPVVGADPSPRRMGYPGRIVYLGAQMPVHAATGLAIYFASRVLYPHYLEVARSWGPTPLVDQQLAGALMWGGGDLVLIAAIVLCFAALLGADERRARRHERRFRAASVTATAGTDTDSMSG